MLSLRVVTNRTNHLVHGVFERRTWQVVLYFFLRLSPVSCWITSVNAMTVFGMWHACLESVKTRQTLRTVSPPVCLLCQGELSEPCIKPIFFILVE